MDLHLCFISGKLSQHRTHENKCHRRNWSLCLLHVVLLLQISSTLLSPPPPLQTWQVIHKTGVWFAGRDTDVRDHFKLHHRWLWGLCFMPWSHLLPYPETQGSFFLSVRSIDVDVLKRLCPTCYQHKLRSQPLISNLHLLPLYPPFDGKPLKSNYI